MGYSILQLPDMAHALIKKLRRLYSKMKSRDGPVRNKLHPINVLEALSSISHDTEMENLEPRVKLAFEKRDKESEERELKIEEQIRSMNRSICDIQKLLNERKRF